MGNGTEPAKSEKSDSGTLEGGSGSKLACRMQTDSFCRSKHQIKSTQSLGQVYFTRPVTFTRCAVRLLFYCTSSLLLVLELLVV